jgi:signal transduction histidine kinase
MAKVFTYLLNALFTTCLCAQSGSIRFKSITTQDGLESGYNYHLCRDSRGFLWASSVNGVYRADGLQVRAFHAKDGMLGNIVQSNFHEDGEGNLWFSTYNGINQYHRTSGVFSSFQIADNERDTIREDYYLICIEQNKTLWFRAGNGLWAYDIPTGHAFKKSASSAVRYGVSKAADGKLKRIFGCLWMNGAGLEVFTFDAAKAVEKKTFLTEKTAGKSFNVVNLLVENDTLTWLFSNWGLLAFNPLQPQKKEIFPMPSIGSALTSSGVFYGNQYLLVTRGNSTPLIFDRISRKFAMPGTTPFNLLLKKNNYYEMLLDREGNLWLGHEKNPVIEFGNLLQAPFFQGELTPAKLTPEVTSILETATGEIWCSTETEGVFVYNGKGVFLRQIPYKTKVGSVFDLRGGLMEDETGQVWASNGNSLFRLDHRSVSWEVVDIGSVGSILRIGFVGQSNGFVSTSSGLFRLRFANGKYFAASTNLFSEQNGYDGLLTFFGENDYIYSYSNGKILVQSTVNANTAFNLTLSSSLNTVVEDPQTNQTWFGTTKGLFRWQWGSNKLETIANTGVDDKMVTSIAVDGEGALWMGSYDGLHYYNPKTKAVYHYPLEDGLPSANFSLSASLTATDGKIWFGTANGPVMFDPKQVRPFPYGPKLHIETFEVNNQPYRGVPVASEASRIELPYFDNNLAFGLKAVGFYLPKLSTIYYRLTNFDDEWRELENGGIVRYPKLPPGEYLLEAYAVNANGVKGEARHLSIHIQPPWWQLWWFKLLVALFLAGIAYTSFRLYVRRKLMEQQRIFERQKALQDERNRIAAELHDDLGSGLSVIRFLSDHTLHQEQPGDQRQSIHRIYQSAGELLEKMSDIIWAMNAENDSLANLTAYLQGYAYEFLDINHIGCHFELPTNLPTLELSGVQRRNILLAFKETLHNIVKHAAATAVSIVLCFEDGVVKITIHDNGKGIDLTNLRVGGNGVRNLRKRMEAVGGTADIYAANGTVVVLSMPVARL